MKKEKEIEYLTDDELNLLIQEIEQQELVSAPPWLQDQILEAVRQEENSELIAPEAAEWQTEAESMVREAAEWQIVTEERARNKLSEYRRFRFRVLTTVAVAVLAVFLQPKLEPLNLWQQETGWMKAGTGHEFQAESQDTGREKAFYDRLVGRDAGREKVFHDRSVSRDAGREKIFHDRSVSRDADRRETFYNSRALGRMLGGVNIFADNDRWNLFRK